MANIIGTKALSPEAAKWRDLDSRQARNEKWARIGIAAGAGLLAIVTGVTTCGAFVIGHGALSFLSIGVGVPGTIILAVWARVFTFEEKIRTDLSDPVAQAEAYERLSQLTLRQLYSVYNKRLRALVHHGLLTPEQGDKLKDLFARAGQPMIEKEGYKRHINDADERKKMLGYPTLSSQVSAFKEEWCSLRDEIVQNFVQEE